MDIKSFKSDLILTINGDSNWYFDNQIKFSHHATNFSSIILNHVINKYAYDNDLVFDNNFLLDKVEPFMTATLKTKDKVLFVGTIRRSGRLSLKPSKLKEQSIIIEDIRSWLSNKTPTAIQFINTPPLKALNEFVKALNEPKIKLGKISLTDQTNINAYDTTNKSPYSILKEVIARQTRSFLYFDTDELGNIVINFASEQDLKLQKPITISNDNELFADYQILDIVLDTNNVNYINKLRVESEHVISDILSKEEFEVNSSVKSVWLKHNLGRLAISDELDCYYFKTIGEDKTKKQLNIVSKKEATSGKDYHCYYQKNNQEIVLNERWERQNITIGISYYKKSRFGFTVENTAEINKLHLLSGFSGDVYRYDKYNDYSNAKDLYKFAKHELAINSKVVNELKITTTKPFLNIGDVVKLDYGINKIDGRYICMGYEGIYKGSSKELLINYFLRNSLNSDTIINFYDNQSFRDKPLDYDGYVISRIIDVSLNYVWLRLLINSNKLKLTKEDYPIQGYLKNSLPYNQNNLINLVSVFNYFLTQISGVELVAKTVFFDNTT